MIAWYAAVAALLTVLFVAPLVLASHVVVRQIGSLGQLAWFAFLSLLLLGALAAGALAVVLMG